MATPRSSGNALATPARASPSTSTRTSRRACRRDAAQKIDAGMRGALAKKTACVGRGSMLSATPPLCTRRARPYAPWRASVERFFRLQVFHRIADHSAPARTRRATLRAGTVAPALRWRTRRCGAHSGFPAPAAAHPCVTRATCGDKTESCAHATSGIARVADGVQAGRPTPRTGRRRPPIRQDRFPSVSRRSS